MSQRSLSGMLLSHLGSRVRERAASWEQLEDVLQEILASCRAAWPKIELAPQTFLEHLAARVPELRSPDDLRRVKTEDLYLACACCQGMAPAVAEFERRMMPEVDRALSRMRIEVALIDEVKQRLRLQLLVGEASKPPRISLYGGRGSLLSWLRVTAVRETRMRMRAGKRTVAADEDLLANLASPDEDQELATLKRLYRAEFKEAFQAALASLDNRERNLLRYHYLEGLSIDDIGSMFGVHRATAARWLVNVRQQLLERTRERMMHRLRVQAGELESIMRLIESRLEASIQQFLDLDRPRE